MKRWGPPLLIALVAAAIYAPILRHPFVNLDDLQTIAANPSFTPPSGEGLLNVWKSSAAGLYVPLTYSVWWLVAHLGFQNGVMRAWPFHLLSVSLHIASGWLVWSILRRMQYNPMAALIGALVFVAHPVQVETVAWASGAKDQLATVLTMLAVLVYFGGKCNGAGLFKTKTGEGSPSSNRHLGKVPLTLTLSPEYEGEGNRSLSLIRRGGLLLLVTVAMLAKPVAVMTPLIIAALDWIYYQRSVRCIAARLWPTLLPIIPIVLVARSVQTIWPAVVTPLWMRPLIAGDALAFYLVKLLWPATLTHLYARTPMLVAASPTIYFSWLLPTLTALILLAIGRRHRGLLAGGAVFFLALLPVLGFTPFEFQIHSTVADHYLYLPMAGVALAVAEGLTMLQGISARGESIDALRAQIAGSAVPKSPRATTNFLIPLSVFAVIGTLALRSAFQIPFWQSSVSLNRHAVAVRQRSVDAHGSLAVALAESGQIQAAVPELQFVVANAPQNRMGHLRLAQAYLALHEFDNALPEAVASARLTLASDHDVWPDLFLAEALQGLGRNQESRAALEAARRIDPKNQAVLGRLELADEPTSRP